MKIIASQFEVSSIQLAVFSSNPGDITSSKILTPILSKYSALFNSNITVLPIPPDAPIEIPRVSMQSTDGAWKLQGGPLRIDLVWSDKPERAQNVKGLLAQGLEIINYLLEQSSIHVGRCALVLNRVMQVNDAATQLSKHFCNDKTISGPLCRSQNFELHNHKQFDLKSGTSSITVNSWVRCKTATTIDDTSIIVVEQDLNSLPKTLKSEIPLPLLNNFFTTALNETETILTLYFPEK